MTVRVAMAIRYLLLACLVCAPSASAQTGALRDAGALRAALASQLDEADLDHLSIEHTAPIGRDGGRVLYVIQTLGSVPVRGTEAVVALDGSGAPRYVRGALRRDLGRIPAQVPLLTAAAGGNAAARSGAAALSTDAVYLEHDGALRLVWESLVPDGDHTWLVHTDARTGAELGRHDLTIYDTWDAPAGPTPRAPASASPPPASASGGDAYRVFAAPVASPLHTPGGPAVDSRSLVEAPADGQASPFGWHDEDGAPGDEFDETRGNNVWAYLDEDGDNLYHPGDAAAGTRTAGGLVFDVPLDLSAPPIASREAAVTNAFYWTNLTHDVLWHLGFDEASGNFQTNTYGRGGAGDDAMRVEVLDGRSLNSASYVPRPDGVPSRIQLGEFTLTDPRRDASFDAAVVVHEYVHGLSLRLVGGRGAINCLRNEEQMGEGWSDWYGMMLTMDADDARNDPRGIGAYVLGGAPGTTFRPAPYSTSFALNDYTHARIREFDGPHDTGFVWATILWEATWDMIDAYGFSPDLHDGAGTAGNQMMLRLVTEALKLTACRAGFVDARDAILVADAFLFPVAGQPGIGRHSDVLWGAFQRRGLGGAALQGDPDSRLDNVDSFDPPLPPEATFVDTRPIMLIAPLGTEVEHAVRVENRAPSGQAVLVVVVSIQEPDGTSPSWLSVEPDSLRLSAGEVREIILRVDTQDISVGTHYATVTFTTNDVLVPRITVPLRVLIPPPLSASVLIPADEIALRLNAGEFKERTITITNTAPPGSSAVAVTARGQLPDGGTPHWLSVSSDRLLVSPGTSRDVTLTLGADNLQPIRYTAVVQLDTNDPGMPRVTVPVELTVAAEMVQSGDAGWRLISFPLNGIGIRDLATMNLVQGIEGFYPEAAPNLVVGYDGTRGETVLSAQTLAPGTSVWWYLFDEDRDPGGPSVSYALPHTLVLPWPQVRGSYGVAMAGSPGSLFALGNPYDAPLDVGAFPSGWPSGVPLRSFVFQMWDPAARTYETSLTQPAVPPWQGFLAEIDVPAAFRIPESARSPSGVTRAAATSPFIGFELAEAAGPLRDRAAVVRFKDEASLGRDWLDAAKLDPFGDVGITLSIVGSDGELRAVESRPMPDSAAVIPLAVAARGGSGEMVLRWPYLEALPADWGLRLFDVVTGTSLDLLAESEYRFSVTPAAPRDPLAIGTRLRGTPTPRFKLVAGRASTFPTDGDLAPTFSLAAPFPNPSRGDARARFSLAETAPARLSLIDALGRELAVLADGLLDAGDYEVPLSTSGLAAGVYVLRLAAGERVLTRRVTVAR